LAAAGLVCGGLCRRLVPPDRPTRWTEGAGGTLSSQEAFEMIFEAVSRTAEFAGDGDARPHRPRCDSASGPNPGRISCPPTHLLPAARGRGREAAEGPA